MVNFKTSLLVKSSPLIITPLQPPTKLPSLYNPLTKVPTCCYVRIAQLAAACRGNGAGNCRRHCNSVAGAAASDGVGGKRSTAGGRGGKGRGSTKSAGSRGGRGSSRKKKASAPATEAANGAGGSPTD